MPVGRRPGALRALLAHALVAPLLAGCYSFAQPSFHPGNARELLVAITRRGVEAKALAGSSACTDPTLVANALHIRATVAADPVPRDVWVYSFRPRGWEQTQAVVDACEAEYAAANPDARIVRIDVPVSRVFGADWSPELERAVRAALDEVANAGLPGR
ncbi:MAG: hypothetical protein ACKOTZ_08460 [Chloroflexota bacterium]